MYELLLRYRWNTPIKHLNIWLIPLLFLHGRFLTVRLCETARPVGRLHLRHLPGHAPPPSSLSPLVLLHPAATPRCLREETRPYTQVTVSHSARQRSWMLANGTTQCMSPPPMVESRSQLWRTVVLAFVALVKGFIWLLRRVHPHHPHART